MDPLRFLAERDGFFTRAMAREHGYTDRQVDAMHRLRLWTRFRFGYYTFPDLWLSLDEVGRHRVRCRAVAHSLGTNVVLSHVSSLVLQGIEPWGLDLSRVHVTRLDGGAGRIEGDIAHHVAAVAASDVTECNGLLVTGADRAAIEAATQCDGEVALCLFNQVLNAGLCTDDQLCRRFEAMSQWPGTQRLHVPVRMADSRSASVGESRGFWLFRSAGLPAPIPQFEVRDSAGVLRGTCDWGWPEHEQLGEFDGAVKYGRLLAPGQDAGSVVFAEKQREDELREITGYGMIRFIWADYQRPRASAQRLRRGLGIAA